MPKKFSNLAAVALAAYVNVASRQHELEDAREGADHAAGDVVAALKSTPKGKVALVDGNGDVDVYTLCDGAVGYKVESIAGDFDFGVPEPTEPHEADGPVS